MDTSSVLREVASTDSDRAAAAYSWLVELPPERLRSPEWWPSSTSFQTPSRATSILSSTRWQQVHLRHSTTLRPAAIRCPAWQELRIVLPTVQLVTRPASATTRRVASDQSILQTCYRRGPLQQLHPPRPVRIRHRALLQHRHRFRPRYPQHPNRSRACRPQRRSRSRLPLWSKERLNPDMPSSHRTRILPRRRRPLRSEWLRMASSNHKRVFFQSLR